MNSERIWTVFTVAIIAVMAFTALTDFATSGWLLIPAIGLALYLLISAAVQRGVENARR